MRQSVVSRGHHISYRTEGAGVPLLLLCGRSRWADTWWDAGYVEALSEAYPVIAVDPLGHGESDKPHDPGEYFLQSLVSDIVAVLDAEQVDRVLVWGFSMGLVHGASLAVLHPSRVAGLVCGGGAPMVNMEGRRERLLAHADLIRTDEGMTAFLESVGATDETIAESLGRNDSAALSAALAGEAEWFPDVGDLAAPSLWYVGSDDGDGFTGKERELAERFGVETHLIPHADHVASFRRASDVIPIVEPFLGRHHV